MKVLRMRGGPSTRVDEMKAALRHWFATLVVASSFAGAACATTIYVSPNGSDANDGLGASASSGSSGPVATLGKALQVLRKSGAASAGKVSDRIVLGPGVYELSESVRLDTRDSRAPEFPLIIEAARPGTVVLLRRARVGAVF